MNDKEISELRRRFRAGKNNISAVRGCYVNERREIVSDFTESLTLLPEDEVERILGLLKKSLSGTLGKNLVDLTFETRAVVAGDEHRLLSALRDTELKDDEKVRALYRKIIDNLTMEGSYLILLGYDAYDVPYRAGDDAVFAEASTNVFRYLVCSVCPVKQTKPALSFAVQENRFRSVGADWVLSQPELGFVFPAFDDRATNLYGALYYTRNPADNHPDFVQAVFNTPLLMPAAEQKTTFQDILSESVGEDCSYQVVQAMQDQLTGLMEEHKEQHIREPLRVSHSTLEGVLASCGVTEEKQAAFGRQYEEAFGEDVTLSPRNLVDPKHMEVATPDVTIQVNPQRSELVQTRIIDGVKYILIRAEEGVSVNGVNIHIS
ncbi:MAG: DUF4317 domain-containing protein [Oscillospiraceae bacterium]|nr:DUF4317 domain-containing protein [Oscillospiraceae bacterium]